MRLDLIKKEAAAAHEVNNVTRKLSDSMSNLWKDKGIPHKGWVLQDVEDVEEDYEVCMMCGKEDIRYVHVLTNPDVETEFRVGCVCAEKMTDDYINPRAKENEVRKKAGRLKTWLKKEWKESQKGNLYLKVNSKIVSIFQESKSQKYKVVVDGVFGNKTFDTVKDAQIAAFKGIEYFKSKGEW